MKELLFLAVMVPVFATLGNAQDKWREVDLRINGVGSGSSQSVVLAKLGKPAKGSSKTHLTFEGDCFGADSTTVTLDYPGLKVVLLGYGSGKNLEVVEMWMTSGNRSASGIRIGASPAQVKGLFGKPNSIQKNGAVLEFYYATAGNQGAVIFRFTNGRLTTIGMSETLC